MADADRCAWVDEGERPMAACFTAVLGVDVEEAVRRFGGELATQRVATFDEAFNEYPDTQHLLYERVGDAVLVAEHNGWEGSRPEVAEAVSRDGRLASVYWSVNADMSFVYAVEGIVVAWFDPLLIEQPWAGSDPGAVVELCRDLSFGVEGALRDSFTLLERLTGVVIEQDWLLVPHRCVDVTPLPDSA